MLAQNNEYLQEAVSGVAQLSAEEQIRQRCEAREYYYARERHITFKMAELEQQVTEQQSTIDEQQSTIDEQQATIDEQQSTLTSYADKELHRIRKKVEAGKSLEQIAEELEDDVENIRPLYNELIALNQ